MEYLIFGRLIRRGVGRRCPCFSALSFSVSLLLSRDDYGKITIHTHSRILRVQQSGLVGVQGRGVMNHGGGGGGVADDGIYPSPSLFSISRLGVAGNKPCWW
ncbi:hypothetical protein CEXT_368821 [Caerostris extrusa]|uniref:Uncharacterized protein n=1 Tax=Caerostris extrusa TaxID=172846 RepID=A0AAV4Q9I5_CAEEX|nr:hypothetical protein CEXT_368821 [Caerostris extrusa]